jgi:hypothetical protein
MQALYRFLHTLPALDDRDRQNVYAHLGEELFAEIAQSRTA